MTGSKFSNTESPWWWPWGGGVSDDPELPMYELVGDIHVHGLMNGELGAEFVHDLEEIITS